MSARCPPPDKPLNEMKEGKAPSEQVSVRVVSLSQGSP